jgi:prepilin-type N-terminal cleavage/methylation domain-containing protein
MLSNKGYTLIEVVIAAFILGTIVVGLFSLITLTLRASHDGQRKIVATALANEKMEQVRNLPYNSVGTSGGIPFGTIPQSQQIVRNGDTYTVATDIRYIDDSYDGTASSTPRDTVNTDYKQVRVEVSWVSNIPSRSVLLITDIVPSGIEGGDSLGTLIFQALNSAGVGVANATVNLTNSSVSPAINLTTTTNSTGQIVVPGLPVSAGTYQVSVTKSGYTTSSASFTPDVDHSALTAIAGDVTNKTFAIDTASSLTIKTVDATNTVLPNIAYSITGTKKIGTNATNQPVYLFSHQDSTDASGSLSYQGVVWDSYVFAIDGAVTGYDIQETSSVLPLVIAPGTDTTLAVILAPHTPLSLHMYVVDASNNPVVGAAVAISLGGFNQTLTTGTTGQVFFSNLATGGDYSAAITASGYQAYTSTVTVDGNNQNTASLAL